MMSIYHQDQIMHVKKVTLMIRNLNTALEFYHDILGLHLIDKQSSSALLGTSKSELIQLIESKHAIPVGITQGLYHFALLLPSREELARVIYRLKSKSYPISGASDHGVSESIYLDDPEGNGLEIYHDLDSRVWPLKNGKFSMYTKPLNIKMIMDTLSNKAYEEIHEDTVIGHIHLHVQSLEIAKQFYIDLLGFDLMYRFNASALFVSSGSYHHHMGLNTWHEDAPLCQERQVGLKSFVLSIPKNQYSRFLDRLSMKRIPLLVEGEQKYIIDPLKQLIYIEVKNSS